jgi:fluoroacetyl-CoA thioesterase
MDVTAGLQACLTRVVTDDDTAIAMGSGDVPVLATPRLLAWFEAATVAALEGHLDDAETSVGANLRLTHRAPSRVGSTLTLNAEVVAVEGPTVFFEVTAFDAEGTTVARGEVNRAVVDRGNFLNPG